MQKIASQNPHQKLHKMTIHKHDGDSDGIGTQVPAGNWIGEAMAQRPLSTAPRCRMLGAHRSRSTWNQNWPPQHLHVFHSICVQCIVFVLVEILKQTSTKVCEVWEMRQQNKTGNKLQTTPLVSQVCRSKQFRKLQTGKTRLKTQRKRRYKSRDHATRDPHPHVNEPDSA